MKKILNDRIKLIRKSLGLTQDEFGKRLGLTRGAITNIELNKTEPKPLLIDLICRIFNVNEDWLRTGEGEMFLPLTRSEKIAKFAGKILRDESPSFQRQLVELLAELDTEEWEMLERFAQKLAKKNGLTTVSP